MIKYILFDFGGVFTNKFSKELDSRLAKYLGIAIAELQRKRKKLYLQLELGKITQKEYSKLLLKRLNIRNITEQQLTKKRLELDNKLLIPNLKMFKLLKKLNKDYTTVLFTNITKLLSCSNQQNDYYKHFKRKFLSCNVGLRKPDISFYRYVLKKLKAKPEECLMVDDNQINLKVAKKLGIRTDASLMMEKSNYR